ncbi:MAG: NADP-dependent oxidoreductase [Alphaproteobacteria bacterium]
MTTRTSREIRLKSRPTGMPKPENFELAEVTLPEPGDNQLLVRNIWMSVDPYMRGRMIDRRSYVPPYQVGAALDGGAIGVVEASNHPDFKPGDHVNHMMGWREYLVSDGRGLRKVDGSAAPLQAYLGVLGMPGLTAYAGLLRIGEPKEGETVFVSAAAGAVGSVVGQIARIRGCRVAGSAGSDEKVRWLTEEAGFDAGVNYKAVPNLQAAMAEACPNGIDVYFENVGGAHLVAALNLMNTFGRIPLCGMISQYNLDRPEPGPYNLVLAVAKSLKLQGFVVGNYLDMLEDFYRDMPKWIAEGRVKWKETVREGIESAPDAFLSLFTGDKFGKMLVKLS